MSGNRAPERPSWQQGDCPGWCAVPHHESDHVEDRVHRSAGRSIETTLRRAWFDDSALHAEVGEHELEAGLMQLDGAATVWLYLGAGSGREIMVDAADGDRLVVLLAQALSLR